MEPQRAEEKLSQIQTLWTAIRETRAAPAVACGAQVRLLERYLLPIQRYLRTALRDPDAAADVCQEFVLRFLRGGYDGADPVRGRFRDFLATVLRNLVIDHERARKRQPESLGAAGRELEDQAAGEALDRTFQAAWCEHLMASAWKALARHDRQTGQHLHRVLRFKADHLTLRSPEIARRLSELLGKAVSPEWVRKWLPRAGERFKDLFLDEVARSLRDARPETLEQELADLELLDGCRGALERRRESILGG